MATKTNVIGYFNPNEYPLQIPLSDLNTVLQLQPKHYVVDRSGRLVNDPRLDAFVGKGKLARASDQKQQVDIILLRPVNDPTGVPVPHEHSVVQASRFDVKNGRVTPVMATPTAAQPTTPPPVSYNPVRGMTVEQAKQLKLIRPTRVVPEDFGADETTGAPAAGQNIPTIKYATDSVRGRKPAPLPAELAQPATPQQQAIIQGLERSASSNIDDALDGDTALPVVALPPPVLTEATPQRQPVRMTPPPIPSNPVPTATVTLPPPTVEEESSMVVEDELPGAAVETNSTVVEEAADVSRHGAHPEQNVEATGEPVIDVTCPLCNNRAFTSLGRLQVHARAKHPDQLAQILARYA